MVSVNFDSTLKNNDRFMTVADGNNYNQTPKTMKNQIIKQGLDDQISNMNESKLEVFVTKDKDLLQQYYNLRHRVYREENGWDNYDGSENEYDRNGQITVVVENGKVVAGSRLMISTQNELLSNEIANTEFVYRPLIEKYDERKNLAYSEISAVVVGKEHRDRKALKELFIKNIEISRKYGCSYICGVAVAVVCRDYRITFKNLGYYLEILMKFFWKESSVYNSLKMFPVYVRID